MARRKSAKGKKTGVVQKGVRKSPRLSPALKEDAKPEEIESSKEREISSKKCDESSTNCVETVERMEEDLVPEAHSDNKSETLATTSPEVVAKRTRGRRKIIADVRRIGTRNRTRLSSAVTQVVKDVIPEDNIELEESKATKIETENASTECDKEILPIEREKENLLLECDKEIPPIECKKENSSTERDQKNPSTECQNENSSTESEKKIPSTKCKEEVINSMHCVEVTDSMEEESAPEVLPNTTSPLQNLTLTRPGESHLPINIGKNSSIPQTNENTVERVPRQTTVIRNERENIPPPRIDWPVLRREPQKTTCSKVLIVCHSLPLVCAPTYQSHRRRAVPINFKRLTNVLGSSKSIST